MTKTYHHGDNFILHNYLKRKKNERKTMSIKTTDIFNVYNAAFCIKQLRYVLNELSIRVKIRFNKNKNNNFENDAFFIQ